MLSILSCTSWPSVYLIWRNVYLDLLPFFWLGHLFVFRCWLVWTICMWVLVIQSCLTLCDPVDCSLSGFTVHSFLQARILEWVAIPFSRGSSQPRDRTQGSHIAGGFFTSWASREAQINMLVTPKFLFLVLTLWTPETCTTGHLTFPLVCLGEISNLKYTK